MIRRAGRGRVQDGPLGREDVGGGVAGGVAHVAGGELTACPGRARAGLPSRQPHRLRPLTRPSFKESII
jgi:hypothetical protein